MVKTKFYEITRKRGCLSSMLRVDSKSPNTRYVVEFNDYGRKSPDSKTINCNIFIIKNGIKENLNINEWNLFEPIQVKKREWDNSSGYHYYVEISIKCPTVCQRTIKLFTKFNEENMITRVMETLGIMFICHSFNEFQKVMEPLMDKNKIIDWRLPLTGDRLWKFAKAINSFDFLPNSFSEQLFR